MDAEIEMVPEAEPCIIEGVEVGIGSFGASSAEPDSCNRENE